MTIGLPMTDGPLGVGLWEIVCVGGSVMGPAKRRRGWMDLASRLYPSRV
jgi:hypothetical protein